MPLRRYNFAASAYADAMGDLPTPDGAALRAAAVAHVEAHDPQEWYADPVTTVIAGQAREGGVLEPTLDAFGHENGRIRMATAGEVDELIAHLRAFAPARALFKRVGGPHIWQKAAMPAMWSLLKKIPT